MSNRIQSSTLDKDNNLVITIRKYGGFSCLFHSIFALILVLCLVGCILLFVFEEWIYAVFMLVICIVVWIKTWLNANESLTSRIYSQILKDYLFASQENNPPVIIQYVPSKEVLRTLMTNGEICEYRVEFIMEKLPLFVVKINTKAIK